MRIVITGGTGFVGKNLLPKLIKSKHNILQITTNPDKCKKLYGESTEQFHFNGYENNLAGIVSDFNPEVVIHLASYLTASDRTEDMHKLIDVNVHFLCYLLDAIKKTNIKWFINTGSFAEYYNGDGVLDPAYLYTAAKTASRIFIDYYSKAYSFNYMTIAPYTIYGGEDTQKKIIDIIYDSLGSKQKVDLTKGEQVLDFIHIEDVSDFYISCIANLDKIPNKTNFHLGTGVGHTLKQIVTIMEKETHKTANINWGGKSYRPRDVMHAVANISQQDRILNWRPKIKLEEGIINYLKNKDR